MFWSFALYTSFVYMCSMSKSSIKKETILHFNVKSYRTLFWTITLWSIFLLNWQAFPLVSVQRVTHSPFKIEKLCWLKDDKLWIWLLYFYLEEVMALCSLTTLFINFTFVRSMCVILYVECISLFIVDVVLYTTIS